MARLPFKSMETIEAVVRLGSASRAAKELGLSQSAVSNSVRRFEHDLGRDLFSRDCGALIPLPSAVSIAHATAGARGLLETALGDLRASPEMDVLRLSVAPTLASRWLAPRLDQLRSVMHPVRVQVDSRVDLSDPADIWLRHGKTGRWPNLQSARLLTETKVPVVAPELLPENLNSDGEVLKMPLLGVEARPCEWKEWAQKSGLKGSPPAQFTFEVTSSAWEAAVAGSGVALGDLQLLSEEFASGKLKRLGETALTSYAYFVCRHKLDERRPVLKAWKWLLAKAHATAGSAPTRNS